MQNIKLILCLLCAFAAHAQYTTIATSDTPAGSVSVLNAKLAFTIASSAPSTCVMGKEVWIDSGTLNNFDTASATARSLRRSPSPTPN